MLSYCDILFFYLTIQLLAARVFNKPRSFSFEVMQHMTFAQRSPNMNYLP